ANTRLVGQTPVPELLDTGGDGTSYATTHVAAAAALWLTKHANDLRGLQSNWRLVETFRKCLQQSAKAPSSWNTRLWGAGILDIVELLNCPLPDPATLEMAKLAKNESF